MRNSAFIETGITGAIVSAIRCAAPVLLISLGALGLAARVAWAALAALVGFVLLAAYGFWRRRTAHPRALRRQTTH